MAKKFYVTTPIYYANGLPHIGHAYSSFIADVFARYKRLLGYDVKFATWLDENGQKMVQKAEEENKSVMQFLDEIAVWSLEIWKKLDISYTDFIRTTEDRHHKFVKKVLSKIFDKEDWDIYQWEYEWLYCIGCEAFKRPTDLVNWVCPDHLTKPDIIKEKNWFFNLKKYQAVLEAFFEKNPTFVQPKTRFNEVKSFVSWWLENFSISRETNTFGIKLPFDDSQVTYVWFDALLNYITVCQEENEKFWSDDTHIVHVLGKDIVKFHATYWPAILESAWYRMPDQEFVTWYLTVDWQKMSKSIGNVVDPVKLVEDYDRDAAVFYLLYDAPIWADWDFSRERFAGVYDSVLIWAWGNLVNRVVSLCSKYGINEWKCGANNLYKFFSIENEIEWIINQIQDTNWVFPPLASISDSPLSQFIVYNYIIKPENKLNYTEIIIENNYLKSGNFQWYLKDRYKIVQRANEFITQAEPWKKYKDEATKEEAISDLKFLLYIVKNLALLSAPFLINGFAKIQTMFGNETLSKIDSSKNMMDDSFQKAFDMKEFIVDLKPEIIYKKVEVNS